MGAVEDAQIREATRVSPDDRLPPETLGVVLALSHVLALVADDLGAVVKELEGHEAETREAYHALGLVTGAIAALGGMVSEGREE